MRRRTPLLAVGFLAFFVGASLDQELRTPKMQDCACMSLKCRLVAVADHPLLFLSQPLETLDLLFTARGFD
ncbi:MAG TPA: hypothetical protein VF508_03105 [Pyrinomonadaceae bacterium]